MKTLSLPWKAWHGDESVGLFFPESWDVQVCSMAQAPQLTELEIQSALRNSIGGVGLSGVSLNPRSVAIVVDDITRPTPTKVLLPLVLDQLAAAGIAREKIKIIVALGSHAPLSEADLAR